MLWYVIQTYTGKEEKLIEMIRRIIPGDLYGECFVAYHEQLRSRNRENQVHIERIFPGYAFITSDEPVELFNHLKKVPAMSKMMAAGEFYFTPLEDDEASFLAGIMDRDHVIRLSYVATNGRDKVSWLSGPLEICGNRIAGYQFRKRYALVRLSIAGREKEVRLGIILNDDIRREVEYGKVESPVRVTGPYRLKAFQEETLGGKQGNPDGAERATAFHPGDSVIVVGGAFEGLTAVVSQVKKNAVRIGVRLFDRNIMAEESIENIRKTA